MRRRGILGFGLPVLAAFAIVLVGCASMSETEKRTAKGAGAGAAIGAAGGVIFGAMAGSPGTGAAVGAGVGTAAGAAGGYIYDQHKKREEAEAETERLRRENKALEDRRAEE